VQQTRSDIPQDDTDVPIRPAATLILARQSRHGPEVLLLERHRRSAFVAGAHVFPGGALDPADHAPELHRLCTDENTSPTPGDSEALAYRVAAIRESFEEAGVLLARTAGNTLLQPGAGVPAEQLQRYREALLQSRLDLSRICREQAWQLDTASLYYYSRWVTPPGQSRRYDTRFFVCEAPPGQEGLACQRETVDQLWLTPGQAIDRWRREDISLVFPTAFTLQELADFDSVDAVLEMARHRPPEGH